MPIFVYYNKSDRIVLNFTENTDVDLFLDFSNVDEAKIKDSIILSASARRGMSEVQSESISIDTTLSPLSVSYNISQMYIGYNGAIILDIEAENAEVRVEKLEDGQYNMSDDNFGVIAGVVDGELVISNADQKADAGAYKVIVSRKQNGFEQSRVEIPFFIHY